jgi:hypothetical protein
MADDFEGGFLRGLSIVSSMQDIKKQSSANKLAKAQKEEASKITKAFETGGLDAAVKEAKTESGLEVVNKLSSTVKSMQDIKGYESPEKKRTGELIAKGLEKGIIPLDKTGKPMIAEDTEGGGNTLAMAFKNEQLRTQRAEMLKNATDLRKEFTGLKPVGDFFTLKDQYQVMKSALQASRQNPESQVAIDQALVTIYNKILDPGSVVRESEYARTGQNMAFVNQIRGKAEQIMAGGAGLTDIERKALVRMASEVMQSRQKQYGDLRNQYTENANYYGVDRPDIVVGPDHSIDLDVSDFIGDEVQEMRDADGNAWEPVIRNGSVIGVIPKKKAK